MPAFFGYRRNVILSFLKIRQKIKNEETFETFRKIREEYPKMVLCVSTNGLLLSEKLGELLEVGIGTLTVTMNSTSLEILPLLYSHLGGVSSGEFLERQKDGIRKAAASGIQVKLNMVLVPGVNEGEVEKVQDVVTAV